MRRVIVHVAMFVGLTPGVAFGKPLQKVRIETEPKGASVYLNDKENGVKCTTPCDVEVPVGESSVIIELASYEPLIELVEVKAGKKPAPLSRKLVRSVGTIVVEGAGAANGAKITVDGNDTGKVAPAKVDIEAGPHLVTVTSRAGKELFADSVDVNTNQETTVTPKASAGGGDVVKRDPDPQPDPPAIHQGVTAPHERFVTASVAADVGFRSFDYINLKGPDAMHPSDQRVHFDEGGQVLLGGQLELYPGLLLGVPSLRGLFLVGRFQYGVNPQKVTGQNVAGTTTFWQSYEASIHHRWTIADTFTLQVGAGYVRDQFEFNGMQADIDVEPDTDYSALKFAVRASALFGNIEPYAIGEVRDVLDAGPITSRFSGSRVTTEGYRVAAGIAAKFSGSLTARLEAARLAYSWTFVNEDATAANQATSASDTINYVALTFGYSY